MPTLKRWSLETFDNRIYLNGIVYGHTSFSCTDGRMINTSDIKDVEYTPEAPDILVFHTRNTLYTLRLKDHAYVYGIKDPEPTFFNFSNNYVRGFEKVKNDLGLISEKFNCPDLSERMIMLKALAEHDNQMFMNECSQLLSERMLMIELDAEEYSYQYRCAYKSQTGEVISNDYIHREIYNKSPNYLEKFLTLPKINLDIIHRKYGHIKFTLTENYFSDTESDIKPDCKEGQHIGYIRNVGKIPMFVQFSWDKIMMIETNETIPVYYKETGCTEEEFKEIYGDDHNLYQPVPQQDMFSDFSIGGAWTP